MSLMNKVIRQDVLELKPYYVADVGKMDKVIKLDAMENPYELPDELKKKLGEHLAHVAINRYPISSHRTLKQKICHEFEVPVGFNVMLGVGSDELISMLTVACAKPGAKVLAPVPTFVMYAHYAQLSHVQFVGVPRQADFSLDMPAMLKAIEQHQPSIVYLANPNNPTGSWMPEEQIVQITKAMTDIGLVVVDEAYRPFAPGSMISRLPEFPNLVVMRTVSKLGMAGLRLGYMSASEAVLAEIEKVRPPYNLNVLTEAAMLFLLDHMAVFNEQAQKICDQRQELIKELQTLPNVHVFPSEANFVLIRVPNAEQVFNRLSEHKILVKNVSNMHALLVNCLRVTVSTPAENKLFLDVFKSDW